MSVSHLQVVTKAHTANRLVHISRFLDFSISRFLDFTSRTMFRERVSFASFAPEIDGLKKRIIAQEPRGLGGNGLASETASKAPAPQVFEKLMQVVSEDAKDNPFKNSGIRKRNALMFYVLYETGMRSGEILALQIGDIDFQACTISVVRRHDNPHDPRKRQPVAKTLERTLPVSQLLISRLRDYVMEVRVTISGANKHSYFFVTHKRGKHQGQPISDVSFRNRILGPVTDSNLELFSEICRHGFRHNFNYRLSKRIDALNERVKTDPSIKPIGEKEEIQIRKQLNGWSSDDTAHTYNLRHIQEVANKLMREEMDDLSKYLYKASN